MNPARIDEILPILEGAIPEDFCVRKGREIHACSIVNAKSGHCDQDCGFCAQSVHNRAVSPVYPLIGKSRLVEAAERAFEAGSSRFSIVTSGYAVRDEEELETICEAISEILQRTRLRVCASLGVLGIKQLERLMAAGLSRYHHNLESAKSFYPSVCSTRSWEANLSTLAAARSLGLEICSGGIFGMGESLEQRAEFVGQLAQLAPDGVPVNFLVAIEGTRMQGITRLTPDEALAVVRAIRIFCPNSEVIICGGRAHVLPDSQERLLDAGADWLMVGDYLTVKGGSVENDINMIRSAGYRFVFGGGE
ncbi:MAG: biotin synthase BioB [Planctomycetota bacterium]